MEGPQLLYANAIAVQAGAFDVAMDFGYRAGDDEPETLIRVAMSYEHTSVMIKILQRVLDDYQAQLGPLPDLEKATRVEQKES